MQKRIIVASFLGFLLVAQFLPAMVVAAEPPPLPDKCIIRADSSRVGVTGCPASGDCVYATNEACGICCLIGTILYITDWIFVLLLVLVIVFVLWGAFDILTAAGDTEKVTSGRNKIMFAAIGFALALFAKAVPAFVRYLVAPSV